MTVCRSVRVWRPTGPRNGAFHLTKWGSSGMTPGWMPHEQLLIQERLDVSAGQSY
jgi:hypothetical protein